jgi:hypothetical protein
MFIPLAFEVSNNVMFIHIVRFGDAHCIVLKVDGYWHFGLYLGLILMSISVYKVIHTHILYIYMCVCVCLCLLFPQNWMDNQCRIQAAHYLRKMMTIQNVLFYLLKNTILLQ